MTELVTQTADQVVSNIPPEISEVLATAIEQASENKGHTDQRGFELSVQSELLKCPSLLVFLRQLEKKLSYGRVGHSHHLYCDRS